MFDDLGFYNFVILCTMLLTVRTPNLKLMHTLIFFLQSCKHGAFFKMAFSDLEKKKCAEGDF